MPRKQKKPSFSGHWPRKQIRKYFNVFLYCPLEAATLMCDIRAYNEVSI